MRDIKVRVVEFSDRRHYQLQWKDPKTRQKRTRSSGVERTGLKRSRHEPERVAAELEKQLRESADVSRMRWDDFRERHEREVQPGLARSTQDNFNVTFDWVEKIIAPTYLRELTTEAISRWAAKLQEAGLAETSVGLYLREIRAAMNWAAEMGFVREAPKVR